MDGFPRRRAQIRNPAELACERRQNNQFRLAYRDATGGGSYFGPTEAMILMSELPCIPFSMPDTWIVKESCP